METLLPAFLCDSSESDKQEEMLDYILSWTLRCSQSRYNTEPNTQVNRYAKQVLSSLMYGTADRLDHVEVTKLLCWKQSSHIDLWVEVDLSNGERHALIIENKVYAGLRTEQLQKYKEIASRHYLAEDISLHHIVLRSDDDFHANDLAISQQNGFRAILLDSIAPTLTEPTGNALFDEFWLHWWDYKSYKERI